MTMIDDWVKVWRHISTKKVIDVMMISGDDVNDDNDEGINRCLNRRHIEEQETLNM